MALGCGFLPRRVYGEHKCSDHAAVIQFERFGGAESEEDGMRKFVLFMVLCSLLLMIASVAFAAGSETVNGWVSDSKCGVKGANAAAEACTKKCIAAGASPVVVTDKDQKVLTVENPDALKDHYGHHVAVTGHVDGDKIHVDSVKML
jgi:hypothetical protein